MMKLVIASILAVVMIPRNLAAWDGQLANQAGAYGVITRSDQSLSGSSNQNRDYGVLLEASSWQEVRSPSSEFRLRQSLEGFTSAATTGSSYSALSTNSYSWTRYRLRQVANLELASRRFGSLTQPFFNSQTTGAQLQHKGVVGWGIKEELDQRTRLSQGITLTAVSGLGAYREFQGDVGMERQLSRLVAVLANVSGYQGFRTGDGEFTGVNYSLVLMRQLTRSLRVRAGGGQSRETNPSEELRANSGRISTEYVGETLRALGEASIGLARRPDTNEPAVVRKLETQITGAAWLRTEWIISASRMDEAKISNSKDLQVRDAFGASLSQSFGNSRPRIARGNYSIKGAIDFRRTREAEQSERVIAYTAGGSYHW